MSNELKPNFTQIPNLILDELLKELTNAELKIILVICRKTYGWHKERDKISRSQFADITGLNKNTIETALRKLQKKNLIIKDVAPGLTCKWEINTELYQNKNYTTKTGIVKNRDSGTPKKGDSKHENYTQKLGNTKESNIKKEKENKKVDKQPSLQRYFTDRITEETKKYTDDPIDWKDGKIHGCLKKVMTKINLVSEDQRKNHIEKKIIAMHKLIENDKGNIWFFTVPMILTAWDKLGHIKETELERRARELIESTKE